MANLTEPLAVRLRPQNINEIVGQEHILGEGTWLRRLLSKQTLSSLILFGPPGSGKTTLAYVLAKTCSYPFRQLNAVTAGVKEIKEVISDSQNVFTCPKGQILLFIDEIHRFNKAQQDALLPAVENGNIILIGATTENPFFEVNKALLSRSSVLELKALSNEAVIKVLQRALNSACGFGNLPVNIAAAELNKIAVYANGDVRRALNLLELLVTTTPYSADGQIIISAEMLDKLALPVQYNYDRTGEEHYNNTSAYIKSLRGSDPDAAIFYLAIALNAGEDPEFLARRLVICASEDVGLANNQALPLAVAALQAVQQIGMPEARIILAHASIYIAVSPKSNTAYKAVNAALADVKSKNTGEIPRHLLNAPISGMQEILGYGKGYKYAHNYPGGLVAQQFLPQEMAGTIYYEPGTNGQEEKIKKWLTAWRDYCKNQVADDLATTGNNSKIVDNNKI